jgi:anti-sigma28 factor (negative regulator of flagellin synthesis)
LTEEHVDGNVRPILRLESDRSDRSNVHVLKQNIAAGRYKVRGGAVAQNILAKQLFLFEHKS